MDSPFDDSTKQRRRDRSAPYSPRRTSNRTANDQWSHDLFDDRRDRPARASDVLSRLGTAARSDRSTLTNNKLVVENLFYEVTQNDVQELFEQIGPVRKAFLQFDRSGRSTGIAEITFENPADAERALKKYNNLELDGQAMLIKYSTSQQQSSATPPHGGNRNSATSGSIFSRLGSVPRVSGAGKDNFRSGGLTGRGGDIEVSRGKSGQSRQSRVGRGSIGRVGRGRRSEPAKPKTQEELDAEMDAYMHSGVGATGVTSGLPSEDIAME